MRRSSFPILMGLLGCSLLCALGVWQVQRLSWKTEMIARIEARIGDVPAPLPPAPDPEADEYMPVTVSGTLGRGAAFVLIGVTGQSPAHRMIVPLDLGGRVILADLGAVAQPDRAGLVASGAITVVGNLHWPDETSSWTPAPYLDKQEWYARDVPALAAHLRSEPTLVVARRHDRPDLPTRPMPVSTRAIPNDHLGYAITWFGLAAVWAIMSVLLIRRTLRSA